MRIWSRIGRRPLVAGGNSNGDVPMLRFARTDGRATAPARAPRRRRPRVRLRRRRRGRPGPGRHAGLGRRERCATTGRPCSDRTTDRRIRRADQPASAGPAPPPPVRRKAATASGGRVEAPGRRHLRPSRCLVGLGQRPGREGGDPQLDPCSASCSSSSRPTARTVTVMAPHDRRVHQDDLHRRAGAADPVDDRPLHGPGVGRVQRGPDAQDEQPGHRRPGVGVARGHERAVTAHEGRSSSTSGWLSSRRRISRLNTTPDADGQQQPGREADERGRRPPPPARGGRSGRGRRSRPA